MSDFNTIKNLYEDGYRCIYYDKLENIVRVLLCGW